MSLLFMDGFDHWNASYRKWPLLDVGSGSESFPSGRAYGGQCWQVTASNTQIGHAQGFNLSSGLVSGVMGVAFKIADPAGLTHSDMYILSVRDGSTVHLCIVLRTDGTFEMYRGTRDAGTLIDQGGAIGSAVWAFMEWKWTIDDTSGVSIYRINGVEVMNFSGDTRNAGNLQWTSCFINAYMPTTLGVSHTTYWDDFFLLNPDATAPNDFLGDHVVRPRRPNGVGNYSQWSKTSGDNYTNVDETTPDGDTTIVYVTTPNQIDTYAHEDVDASSSITATQITAFARKTQEGAAMLAPVIRYSSSDYTGTSKPVTATTYQPIIWPYNGTHPAGSGWTPTNFNGSEAGPKKAS